MKAFGWIVFAALLVAGLVWYEVTVWNECLDKNSFLYCFSSALSMRRLLDLAAEFGLWPTWGLRWRIRNRWRYPTAGSLWSKLRAKTGSGQRYWPAKWAR